MLKPLQTGPQAAWKQRFRTPALIGSQIARDNPARGLICSNHSGIFQLHAWDIPSGQLRQLSYEPHGALVGAISSDGCYVYYPLDSDGDQFGHIARVLFEGGDVQDLTPGFPQYPCSQICLNAAGNILAFPIPRPQGQGTDIYVLELLPDEVGKPQQIFHDPIPGLHGRKRLGLSGDGSILVFASNERNAVLVERLLAIDTWTGVLIGDLWD